LVTATRDLPMRWASCSGHTVLVEQLAERVRLFGRVQVERWMFSTSAISRLASGVASLTSAA
jgi:hypothetical protein